MSQPHIHEVGAFNPINAFAQTFSRLAALTEGLSGDSEAIPIKEVARATVESLDLLALITESTSRSALAMLANAVGIENLDKALDDFRAEHGERSEEEQREYHHRLMSKVAQFIPTEVDITDTDT